MHVHKYNHLAAKQALLGLHAMKLTPAQPRIGKNFQQLCIAKNIAAGSKPAAMLFQNPLFLVFAYSNLILDGGFYIHRVFFLQTAFKVFDHESDFAYFRLGQFEGLVKIRFIIE